MLELKKIRKSYKTGSFTQHALKNVSIEFRKNEFVVILRKTVEFFSGFTGANNLDNIYEVIDVITN